MKSVAFIVKNFFFPLIWLLLGIGILSCTPNPIEIEMPHHEPKLVISAQAAPDRFLAVHVSKSFSSLEGPADSLAKDTAFILSKMVENARVQVSFNGQTEILENFGGGLYGSDKITQYFGQPYTLQVEDLQTGLTCSATATMMPAVHFQTVQPEFKRTLQDTTVYLKFSLVDEEPAKNFYMVTVAGGSRKENTPWKDVKEVKSPNDALFLFNDEQFKNGRYEALERIKAKGTDTLGITLSNISEPHYHYLKLYQKAGNIINQLTGEPINLPTNIRNGYGYFSLHNPTYQAFYLKDWID